MGLNPRQTDADTSFQRVCHLRNINDFAQLAKGYCAGELELVTGIKAAGLRSLRSYGELDSQVATLKGYIQELGNLD